MNDLSHLTDAELIEYHTKYKNLCDKSSRFQMVKTHGYDLKFAYHVVRLLDEAEQIILEGEMDLQRSKEAMKSIRRGEWKIEDVRNWAMEKEKALEVAYVECKLPEHAPEEKLRRLLLECIEAHYGSTSEAFQQPDWSMQALCEMDDLMNKYRSKIYGSPSVSLWSRLRRWLAFGN